MAFKQRPKRSEGAVCGQREGKCPGKRGGRCTGWEAEVGAYAPLVQGAARKLGWLDHDGDRTDGHSWSLSQQLDSRLKTIVEVRWEEAGGLDPTELLRASFQLPGAVLTTAGVDGQGQEGLGRAAELQL